MSVKSMRVILTEIFKKTFEIT